MKSFADALGIDRLEAGAPAAGEDTHSGSLPAQHGFVATRPAGQADCKLAFATVAVSALLFLGAIPFAKQPLAPVWAFIPSYQAALVVCDLVTAALLFGQARFSRSAALFVLASGYLFTACLALSHALSFPGLFAPGGVLGGGTQSTAWLYMFWHAGFPLFVIAYALLRDASHTRATAELGGVLVGGVVAVAAALTWLATAGESATSARSPGTPSACGSSQRSTRP